MAEQEHRAPPEVTWLGGPAGGAGAPPSGGRPLLGRVLLALAAVAVVTGAVVSQRQDDSPARQCPAPCLAPGSIVVGAALPLTGVLAPFGTAQQRGVERVLRVVNADGGVEVGGERRRVDLVVRDTASEPDVAGQQALILVRGPFRLTALLGPCAPPVPLVRVAQSRRVPLLSGCQPLPEVGVGTLDFTWEVAPAEPQRAAAVFEALGSSPSRRAGLFLTNERSEAPWVAAARQAGFDVAGTYRPQGRDWAQAVAQARRDGVEVVVAVTQPPQGIELERELRVQGVDPRSAYASEAGLGSAWYAAVGRHAEGTLTDLVHPVPEPATPEQVDEAVAAVSSDLTWVVLGGLVRAQTSERTDLRDALGGATAEVAGQDVRFLSDQASRLPARLARWEDGRLAPLAAPGRP